MKAYNHDSLFHYGNGESCIWGNLPLPTTPGEPHPRRPTYVARDPLGTPHPRHNGLHDHGTGNTRSAGQPQQQFWLRMLCVYLLTRVWQGKGFVET